MKFYYIKDNYNMTILYRSNTKMWY